MAVYGAKTLGSYFGVPTVANQYDSNATMTRGDFVNLEAGQLEVAGAGDFILGVCLETSVTNASTKVLVEEGPFLLVLMENDNVGTTFAATHVGTRFDITGGTGAQLVDTSTTQNTYTAPAGQLFCKAYNPQGYGADSNTAMGLFTVAESQYN